MSDIVVIGSLNIDLVVRVERFPHPGETLPGGDLFTIPGGKGANQAAAVAKLGTSVSMIGRIGRDGHGRKLIDSLTSYGVDVAGVVDDIDKPTGSAIIIIDEKGENSIVISPGANGQVTRTYIDQHIDILRKAKYLLLQYEIPLDSVYFAAEQARKNGVKVIVNPAPYQKVDPSFLDSIDILILNESEATALIGMAIQDVQSALSALPVIRATGPNAVVITLGSKGCVLLNEDKTVHIPAFNANVVDSTAAGDAFIAGFATGLNAGLSLEDAARFANACGAVTVTRLGAQTSLPTLEEVKSLINQLPVEN